MKYLGQTLVAFARRPAVRMALTSLVEHATVTLVDAAIIRLKQWEKNIREFDEVITINVPEING